MEMLAPITITSRVDLFRRKKTGGGRYNRNQAHRQAGCSHFSSDSLNAMLKAVDLSMINGNGASNVSSIKAKKNRQSGEHKFRALHIEDDDEIRFLVKAFLKGYVDVDPAADADEALNQTYEKKYDLIIMDINLGEGLDGIEASRKIRDISYYRDVPIIAATANGNSEIRNQCIEVGMDAFLLKPFMKKDLINTIEQVMEDRLQ